MAGQRLTLPNTALLQTDQCLRFVKTHMYSVRLSILNINNLPMKSNREWGSGDIPSGKDI